MIPSPDDQRKAMTAFNAQAAARAWPFTVAPAQGFEKAELNAAAALWRGKAAGRAMPLRDDMTARVMKPFLTNMTLLENSQDRYRVRLHGSVLARYSGDHTGKYLEEFAHDGLAAYVALYDLVRGTGAPLRVISQYKAPELSYLTGESFVAPLARADDTMVLSITYPQPRKDNPGRAHILGGS
jgi:hypothetical protein